MGNKKNNSIDLIKKDMEKFDWEKSKKELDFLNKKAKEAIKHPHFEYACIDSVNRIIYIKRKPFWKWFSGKKMIALKIIPLEIDNSGWFGTVHTGKKRNKI